MTLCTTTLNTQRNIPNNHHNYTKLNNAQHYDTEHCNKGNSEHNGLKFDIKHNDAQYNYGHCNDTQNHDAQNDDAQRKHRLSVG